MNNQLGIRFKRGFSRVMRNVLNRYQLSEPMVSRQMGRARWTIADQEQMVNEISYRENLVSFLGAVEELSGCGREEFGLQIADIDLLYDYATGDEDRLRPGERMLENPPVEIEDEEEFWL